MRERKVANGCSRAISKATNAWPIFCWAATSRGEPTSPDMAAPAITAVPSGDAPQGSYVQTVWRQVAAVMTGDQLGYCNRKPNNISIPPRRPLSESERRENFRGSIATFVVPLASNPMKMGVERPATSPSPPVHSANKPSFGVLNPCSPRANYRRALHGVCAEITRTRVIARQGDMRRAQVKRMGKAV